MRKYYITLTLCIISTKTYANTLDKSISIFGSIEGFIHFVLENIAQRAFGVFAILTQTIAPAFITLMFVFMGYKIMLGDMNNTLAKSIIKIIILCSLSLFTFSSFDTIKEYLIEPYISTQKGLIKGITQSQQNASMFVSLDKSLILFWNNIRNSFSNIKLGFGFKVVNLFNPVFALLAGLFFLFLYFTLAKLIIESFVFSYLYMSVFPLFSFLFAFERTKGFALNWARSLFAYFLYIPLVAFAIAIVEQTVSMATSPNAETDWQFYLMQIMLFAILKSFSNQIPNVAQTLSGGGSGGGGDTGINAISNAISKGFSSAQSVRGIASRYIGARASNTNTSPTIKANSTKKDNS